MTNKDESTVEQGTKFELEVADILESYGYRVQHNVVLKGRDGAEHQVDVLAEFDGPLHKDVILVECKAYSHNVEKDILMKQLNIREDLRLGHVILATTADFAAGCYKTAAPYKNVTLLNRDKIRSLSKGVSKESGARPSYVKPILPLSKAEKYAKSKAKKMSGGMLKHRPKVKVESVRLACYPYHTVKYHTEKMEKRGLFRKSEVLRKLPGEASADARLGSVVTVNNGVSYELAFISDLQPEDIKLLQHADKKRMIAKREIVASGIDKSVAANRLQRLHSLGLASRITMKGNVKYKAKARVPSAVRGVAQAYKNRLQDDAPGGVVDALLPVGHAINAVGWIGGKVDGVRTVYYPFYDIRYVDEEGTKYNEMFDGITGRITEELRDTMAEWAPRAAPKTDTNKNQDPKQDEDKSPVPEQPVPNDTMNQAGTNDAGTTTDADAEPSQEQDNVTDSIEDAETKNTQVANDAVREETDDEGTNDEGTNDEKTNDEKTSGGTDDDTNSKTDDPMEDYSNVFKQTLNSDSPEEPAADGQKTPDGSPRDDYDSKWLD